MHRPKRLQESDFLTRLKNQFLKSFQYTNTSTLWTLFFLMLTGCASSPLSVHNEYISHQNLASYHVGTPDPLLSNPPIGQRLVVFWILPKKYRCSHDLHLNIAIQFRNHEQMSERFNLPRLKGTYVYDLLNDDYIAKRGILSYKIDLVADGVIIDEWHHPMWVDLILIKSDPTPLRYDEDEIDDEDWDDND